MKINLISVPYDSGQRSFRMGRGPEHLIGSGLPRMLEQAGHTVRITTVEAAGDEVTSAFALAREIAVQTRIAVENAELPVILAGNCIASLGALAGLGMQTGMLWLDAHADFNTPDTSPSGFLDGMALAVITGRCYQAEAAQIPGYVPLRDDRIAMLGVRSIDDGERRALENVTVARSSRQLWQALASIDAPGLYLHIDLDALDPAELTANEFAAPYGLSMHTLDDAIAAAKATKQIAAVALTAYDPAADVGDHGPGVAAHVIRRLCECVSV